MISGFLISSILLRGLLQGRFSFADFYARRARRIFPSLIAVFAVCLPLAWWMLYGGELRAFGKHMAGGAAFVSNVLLWREAGYFDSASETKPFLHLWSLGIEEQFYLVWPVALWWAWPRRLVGWTLLGVAASSFVASVVLIAFRPSAAFYLPVSRFWELLVGAGLAYVLAERPGLLFAARRVAATPMSLIGAALVVGVCVFADANTRWPGFAALIPTFGAALLIAAGPGGLVNRTILSSQLLVSVGLISYPLYLWHWPLLSFATIADDGTPSPWVRAILVSLAVVLAAGSYWFVEKPLRAGDSLRQKTIGLSAAVGGCAVLGAALAIGAAGGRGHSAALSALEPSDAHKNEPWCFDTYPMLAGIEVCSATLPQPPRVVVLGDSHTQSYGPSLSRVLGGAPVMTLAQPRCLPWATSALAAGSPCPGTAERVLDFLRSEESVQTIFIAGHWGYLSSGRFAREEVGWRHAEVATPERAAAFRAAGQQFLREVVTLGRRVAVLYDIPDLDFQVRHCFDFRPVRPSRDLRERCAVDATGSLARRRPAMELLTALLHDFPSVETYDPQPALCWDDECWAAGDGVPWYFNGDHLTAIGSDRVVADLARTLGERGVPLR